MVESLIMNVLVNSKFVWDMLISWMSACNLFKMESMCIKDTGICGSVCIMQHSICFLLFKIFVKHEIDKQKLDTLSLSTQTQLVTSLIVFIFTEADTQLLVPWLFKKKSSVSLLIFCMIYRFSQKINETICKFCPALGCQHRQQFFKKKSVWCCYVQCKCF